jgi:hypothetical protein
MDYELTPHAKDMLQERGIELKWLEGVFNNPLSAHHDLKDGSLEHRLGLVHESAGRVLRVVVNVQVDPPRIITAYFDRTMKGKL